MAALTNGRRTPRKGTEKTEGRLAAATRVYMGGMVAMATSGDDAGYIVPASADRTLRVLGVADKTVPAQGVDASATAAGAFIVPIDQRRGLFDNSAGNDAITESDRGKRCYVVFDNQVALTDNGGLRPMAGIIDEVGSDGVWVSFDKVAIPRQGELVASLNVTFEDLEDADTSQTFTVLEDAPPGVYVVWAVLAEVFAGGTIDSFVVDVGDAANPDLLMDNVSIFTAATIAYGPQVGDVGASPAIHAPAGTIQAVFTSGTGNVSAATTGDITIELWRIA